MSVRQHLIGFSICLAVGIVLSLVGAAAAAVVELPHDVVADSTDMDYARPMLLWAIAFAIACAVVRAYVARRRSGHAMFSAAS